MQKVLITGGSGFFGIPLAKRLLDNKYEVRVFDIQEIGVPELEERVEFIRGDIRNKKAVMAACDGMDFVMHTAAVQPISRSTRQKFWEINVNGAQNVFDASLHNKIKKVVSISSSSPYGIPKEVPITEDTEFNPVCDYGHSKIAEERICREYRDKGLNVIILRPRTLIGKGRSGLFQILYSWISEGRNIFIIGKGDNLFQHLSETDLVNASILSIESDCKNEDFNLGTDRFKSVKEDLQKLIKYVNGSSKIISLPAGLAKVILRILDMFNLAPFTSWHYMTADKPFYFDSSKAKEILGWQPQISNFDMLKENYDWYLSHKKELDGNFGITHRKSTRQKILKLLKYFS